MLNRISTFLRNLHTALRRRKAVTRALCIVGVLLLVIEFIPGLYEAWWNRPANYQLNAAALDIVGSPVKTFAEKLSYNGQAQAYEYNRDYKPNPGTESVGLQSGPRFGAKFETEGERAYTVTDMINNVGVKFTPKFGLATPRQDGNRLIYPIRGIDGQKVISLKASIVKEDMIINQYKKDELEFKYEMSLPDGLEARPQSNGSIGIFGVESSLLGNVSTGSESDAQLLDKARQNGKKSQLLFTIPAPFVVDAGKELSAAKAKFELDGKGITLKAWDLGQAKYPLSIDPSVYIETAAKLMKGNNETNIDFDITNELIQKSQTTGARIDDWTESTDMDTATWDQGIAAAGGYVYRAGGVRAKTAPEIASQQSSAQGSNSTSFVMSMPSTRPAGDLYVALMCHDGTGAITGPSGGGWTEYADTREHAAYYKIGTDQGGGNEAATYTWTGGSEEWYGVILRITGFDSGDVQAGAAGTGSSASDVTPVFPTQTPDADGTLIIRAAGNDADVPSATAWVPDGHAKIDSGSSGGGAGCGFTSARMNLPPLSSVATGTATLADTSISDTYGASTIAINGAAYSPTTETALHWAKFNNTTGAIESPTTGDGTCTNWCTKSAYDLPDERRGMSLVAYNGFLYAMGGVDSTGTRQSTVYIAKIGANGEPQLWHPSGGSAVYWHPDTALNGTTARSYFSAVAYNNRMYLLGGQTNASATGTTTSEYANINPTGTLSSWTGGAALPAARHGQSAQVYNDVLYLIGGANGTTTQSTVYYVKLNSNGSMNSWIATTSLPAARTSQGGLMTTIWGGYIYIGGGCLTLNGSGYCSSTATDVYLISINADGSLSDWNSLSGLDNTRLGHTFMGWQNGLYRFGGCQAQDTSTGACRHAFDDAQYGVISEAGEVSTVNISVAYNGGAADPYECNSSNPYNCDLPPPGDGAGLGGQMLSMSTILNGYLYNIGGCVDYDCSGTTPGSTDISGNISYVSINSSGQLAAPGTCGGTSYGAWCVDSTNQVNGATGVAAAGITTFNGRIYIVGGLDNSADGNTNIYYNSVNTNGSLAGAWSTTTFAGASITGEIAYTYTYSRANPSSAGSNPGNLYIFGGCGDIGTGAGCSSSNYRTIVYKCNITTTGSVSGCSTSNQLQIDSTPGSGGTDGLGIHSGTVNANYIYLIGGFSQAESDKDDVLYAKFDNSNNVVDADGETAIDNAWIESPNKLSVGRRRGWAFGYNGHIYAVGGYDGSAAIPFIEWSKMNVSDGSIDTFVTSSVTINQRWGLTMTVSNSYAYVLGGCDAGSSPSGCTSFESSVQTFQLYNNDSGAAQAMTANANDFTASTDRWGASSAILNGYLYVAGGCISATDCTDTTNNVQYAAISASDGSIGSWASGGNLPLDRGWGGLETAGGTLYYIGGQDDAAGNEQSTVYYTSSISSGNPTWNASAATNGLPAARTKFGSTVWDNRLYVVGGLDSSAAVSSTVYVSPQLNSGGNITSAWSTSTAFNVARTGAAVLAYANNLYLFGGYDGTNYLNDSQFTQINTDGSVDSWTYTTSLPTTLRDSEAIAANGYIYLVGGRSAASTCAPKVLITPVSANTTIASGNNPTGIGEWYETNVRYTGDRYGAAVAYSAGKIYLMGGGCTAPLSTNRHYFANVKSQPMVAKYSRAIDTDTDVFPTKWLMNGLDNSIGARWTMRYRSSTAANGSWGQETNYGDVTLGTAANYIPLDGGGSNTNFARYYYFHVSIDASQTFGYPEDVNRGPTISDISLFFTADPSKRLRHGKTFTGGELQPMDTPF